MKKGKKIIIEDKEQYPHKNLFITFVIFLFAFILITMGRYSENPITGFAPFNLRPFGDLGNALLQFYQSNTFVAEFILYLLIFLGAAVGVFGERFDRGGKAIAIGLGLALSFSLAAFLPGLTLKLGPFALLIFLGILFFVVFKGVGKLSNDNAKAITIAYLISFIFLNSLVPDFSRYLEGSDIGSLLWTIMWIIAFIALIMILIWAFTSLGNAFGLRESIKYGKELYKDIRPSGGSSRTGPSFEVDPEQDQFEVDAVKVKEDLLKNFYMPIQVAHQQIMRELTNKNPNLNNIQKNLKELINNANGVIITLNRSGLKGPVVNQITSLARSIKTRSDNILRLIDIRQIYINYTRGKNVQIWILNLGRAINNL